MYCQNCGTENAGNVCTTCGANLQNTSTKVQNKKPIFKKWWFWVIIVVALIAIVNIFGGNDSETSGGLGSNKDISIEEPNVVENVVEYEIERVFTTDKLQALLNNSFSYTPEAGNQYIVIDTKVKNLTAQQANVDSLLTMKLAVGGVTYDAQGYTVSDDSIEWYGTIEALEESRVYFAVQVPQGTSAENMTLTTTSGGNVSSCTLSISDYESKKQTINMGQEYTDNETLSITFEKAYFTNVVEPPRTDGYYRYYEAENGKKYLVTKFEVKNLKGSALDIENITGIKAVYDGKYKYDGFVCVEEDEGSSLTNYADIDPLNTAVGYYLIEVPEMVENGPVELEIYLLGENYYYTVK